MILTKQYLASEAPKRSISSYSKSRIAEANSTVFSSTKEYDLFISHSYLDKQLVLTLVELFNQANYSVYVDWIEDGDLDRSAVTARTAEVIRNRLKQCRGLSYIATSSITNSKWCPWELGLADGMHQGHACILPVVESGNAYTGSEYLGLYPYIDYSKTANGKNYEFWVTDSKNPLLYTSLRSWLNGAPLINHEK